MSVFQIVALGVIGILVIASAWQILRERSRRWIAFVWLLVWLGAGAAVAVPNSTTGIAKFLGIERGADLIFYCAVIAGLAGFFVMYLGMRKLNRRLTEITRQVALVGARKKSAAKPAEERENNSDC